MIIAICGAHALLESGKYKVKLFYLYLEIIESEKATQLIYRKEDI